MVTLPGSQETGKAVKYTIPGQPVAFSKQQHRETKLISSIHLESQHEGPLLSGPLQFDAIFYLPIEHLYQSSSLRHSEKPDISFLIKFIQDLAVGIIYTNSSSICTITAVKKYSSTPRTEFTITQLDKRSPL